MFPFQCFRYNLQHNKKSTGICKTVSTRYVKRHSLRDHALLVLDVPLLLLSFISIAVYFASIPERDRETKIDTSKYPPETGITLELCAGIVDKELPLEEIAKIEVLEECGYDVPVSNFQRIISYRYAMLAFCTSSSPPRHDHCHCHFKKHSSVKPRRTFIFYSAFYVHINETEEN